MKGLCIFFFVALGLVLNLNAQEASQKQNLNETYSDALRRLGENRPDEAIVTLKKIMTLDPTFWRAYDQIVLAYGRLKQIDTVQASFEELLAINRNNPYAYYGLGIIYQGKQDYPQALASYQRCIELNAQFAGVYRRFINVHRSLKTPEEAIKYLEDRIKLSPENSYLHYGLGYSYRLLQGSWQKGLRYLDQAIELKPDLMEAYFSRGITYSYLGRYQDALKDFKKTLALAQEGKDLENEWQSLNNIGIAYSDQGDYEQALMCYQKSLKIIQELGDRRAEGSTFSNIGHIYHQQGNYGQALEYLEKSLKIVQRLGDRQVEAIILNNMGNAYRRQRDYGQASQYYQKSLEISRQLGDRRTEGITFGNLGNVLANQGKPEQALPYYQKYLESSQQFGDRPGEGGALVNIGHVYAALGDYARALEHLRLALKIAKEINSLDHLRIAHTALARALEQKRPPSAEEALAHYKAAADTIKTLRGHWRQPEEKINYLENKIEVYERLCHLLAQLHHQPAGAGKGYDREAFHYAEESRARTLVELLEESRSAVQISTGVDADLLEKERTLRAGLSEVQVRLERERQAPQIKELEKRRDHLYRDYQDLIGELRRRNPRYAQLKYPEPVTVEHCQGGLDQETVLLEYLLGEESSLLFAVSKESYEVIPLSGRKSIEERAHKLRKTFTLDGTVNTSLQLRYVEEAAALYDLLIKPVEKLLKGKKRIVVAPDGALYYVPFPALLTKKVFVAGKVDFKSLPYLVKSYSVRYAPSASVWNLLAEPRKGMPERQKKLLAFGDPDYEKKAPVAADQVARLRGEEDAALRGAYDERRGSWKRLPYSGEEVRQIARLYPEAEVRLFLRAAATEENVKRSKLWEYERIHFAAHSLANESKPQFSGIILTTEEGSHEDGYLQMYEIFNLRLAARLVVLSGCETSLGQQTKGEGMIGLMRAFMYAGAESIVASLWKIEDQSTSEFMRTFYAGLEKSAAAQALRTAQLDMINGRRYSHPYFWAAFALYGGR